MRSCVGCAATQAKGATEAREHERALGHGVVAVDPGADVMDYTSTIADGDIIGGDAVRLVHASLEDAVAVLS